LGGGADKQGIWTMEYHWGGGGRVYIIYISRGILTTEINLKEGRKEFELSSFGMRIQVFPQYHTILGKICLYRVIFCDSACGMGNSWRLRWLFVGPQWGHGSVEDRRSNWYGDILGVTWVQFWYHIWPVRSFLKWGMVRYDGSLTGSSSPTIPCWEVQKKGDIL